MNIFRFLSLRIARVYALLFCCVLLLNSQAFGQNSRTISYQGLIETSNGSPIKDGNHILKISFYDSVVGGFSLFTESIITEIKAGLFAVEIGSTIPIPATITFDHRLYLGIIVDDGNEMSPRTPLISVPTAIHADVADYAKSVAAGAKGVVTSIDELSGPIVIAGDSSISVTHTGKIIQLHAIILHEPGIRSISDTENTVSISNPNGPDTKIGVANNAISTRKIIDRAVTPDKINQSGATNGQLLKWNGITWFPSEDLNFIPVAGKDITITGDTISVTTPLPIGTVNNSTLRWSGTNWVENTNFQSTTSGLTTINNNVILTNNGQASEVRFYEPNGSGLNFTAFKAQPQSSDIIYTLPASLPSSLALLTVDNSGMLNWSTSFPMQVPFDQITSGINQGQNLTVGNGSLLAPIGTGIVTANQFIGSGSITNAVDLATAEVAGILPIQKGGTNSGTLLLGNKLMISNNGAIIEFGGGTSGQVLSSNGATNAPSWNTINILPAGTTIDNTLRWNGTSWVETSNVKSSSAGQVTANAGVNLNTTSSPLQLNGSSGTTGQFLTSAGAGATPTWTTGSLLTNGTATDNTLRWNGTSWIETSNVTSSSAGLVTVKAGTNLSGVSSALQLNGSSGTTGQFLTSAGAGSTPTWTTGSLLTNGTATDNTLRWNGTSWIETSNVTSSSAGLVTVKAGTNLSGAVSPLQVNGSAGTSGQVLTSAGLGNTPIWSTVNILTNGTATDNTLRWNGASWVETSNVTSSAAGLITVKAGANLSGAASPLQLNGIAGTTGQFLTSAGAGTTPTWTTGSLLTNGTATDNTLRWNGTSWVETANIKSSSAGLLTANAGVNLNGTTSPLQANGSAGTLNYVLTSQGGVNTPQWIDPNTLVNNAWKLTGNSSTTPGMGSGQNYIGTSDGKDLYIGQNGLEHIRISSTSLSTNTIALGVIHTKSVLPGGFSTLITGMTVETLLPSTASNPIVPVGGLFSFSTVNNSFSLGVFCAANSSVYVSGTGNTNTVRALDGIYYVQNTTSGVTHLNGIGVYGSIQTLPFSNNTTISTAAAVRTDYQLNSTNSTITNANGLYVENPFLGLLVPSSTLTTFNGIYIENLTTGTTKRAFLYDGSSGNVPVAITSAGQIGIGRNDPTQSLEIRNGNVLLSNNNNTADELRFGEPSTTGNFYTSFKAGAQSATINYTLPLSLPSANNGLLISSTVGILNWGSSLAWDNSNYRLGANTTVPATTIDANGDLALRENSFTAANGNNNDIAIGNFSFVRVSGPNAAYTITGIGGGVNGKMVILYNSTAQNMTISHNDNNSATAANRIYCKGAVNYIAGQYGVVTLIYNSTDSRWIVVSTN